MQRSCILIDHNICRPCRLLGTATSIADDILTNVAGWGHSAANRGGAGGGEAALMGRWSCRRPNGFALSVGMLRRFILRDASPAPANIVCSPGNAVVGQLIYPIANLTPPVTRIGTPNKSGGSGYPARCGPISVLYISACKGQPA